MLDKWNEMLNDGWKIGIHYGKCISQTTKPLGSRIAMTKKGCHGERQPPWSMVTTTPSLWCPLLVLSSFDLLAALPWNLLDRGIDNNISVFGVSGPVLLLSLIYKASKSFIYSCTWGLHTQNLQKLLKQWKSKHNSTDEGYQSHN